MHLERSSSLDSETLSGNCRQRQSPGRPRTYVPGIWIQPPRSPVLNDMMQRSSFTVAISFVAAEIGRVSIELHRIVPRSPHIQFSSGPFWG